MNYKLLIGLMAVTLWSCSEDGGGFDSGLTPSAFSFTPITGGAVMHYQLPGNADITGLYVYYDDPYGNAVVRSGSTACDSLLLTGFNEAATNIRAEVRLQRRDRSLSDPIVVEFSTLESGPVAFLKSADVHSNWEGFTVSYSTPDHAEGLASVFYLGKDPLTGRDDTVFVGSFALEEAAAYATENFKVLQEVDKPTVIVRAEDFRGNRVGERAFSGIDFLQQAKLDPSEFSFYCPNAIYEAINYFRFTDPKYLFDGDVLGLSCFQNECLTTFAAGPNACGPAAEPMYLDMQQNRITASLRLYNCLYNNYGGQMHQWLGSYGQSCMMPCDVTLYAAADDGDKTPLDTKDMEALSWKRVANFVQDPDIPNAARWCPTTFPDAGWEKRIDTEENMLLHGPEFMEILVPAAGQDEGYRYLKLVINKTFNIINSEEFSYMGNYVNVVTFHELEVYTKK